MQECAANTQKENIAPITKKGSGVCKVCPYERTLSFLSIKINRIDASIAPDAPLSDKRSRNGKATAGKETWERRCPREPKARAHHPVFSRTERRWGQARQKKARLRGQPGLQGGRGGDPAPLAPPVAPVAAVRPMPVPTEPTRPSSGHGTLRPRPHAGGVGRCQPISTTAPVAIF